MYAWMGVGCVGRFYSVFVCAKQANSGLFHSIEISERLARLALDGRFGDAEDVRVDGGEDDV